MAISLSIKKFNNREYAYIVESYRDPSTKRPTSRTLASFGRLDKLLAEDPDAMSKIEARVKELQSNSKAYSNTVKERMLSGVSVSPETTKEQLALPVPLQCFIRFGKHSAWPLTSRTIGAITE